MSKALENLEFLEHWKKKALIGLTLLCAVNVSAQRPSEYQEVSLDDLPAVLAKGKAPDYTTHPAYANRERYRNSNSNSNDDVVMINGSRCVYSDYYSAGIDHYANSNDRLVGVYQNIDREDAYVLVYSYPDGAIHTNNVSGDNLRDMYKYGAHGFYAHSDRNYGAGYRGEPPYHEHSKVGETVRRVENLTRGVETVVDRVRWIVRSVTGR